mmetsp:Transcript_38593/g.99952  ORF Transcript_38593/g.99952 Transcript_38593/m.99952 type:complete len:467 (+) Transcript_38593:90-1490(+)
MMGDEEDEKVCRYCFDGEDDGPLISPCKCSGGQKYVHLKCLRQWQRMCLVSQPTHPDFYDRDPRHHLCNVCKAEFTCPPPTRHELMAALTGPEIAALIDERCIIAATGAFSVELERQLVLMTAMSGFERRTGYRHWIRGVFLITNVKQDDGQQVLPLDSEQDLQRVRLLLGPSLEFRTQEKCYKLAASHALAGVPPEGLAEALAQLRAPCTICLVHAEAQSCGNDSVAAVNLTRPLERAPDPGLVVAALARVCAKSGFGGARHVQLQHFIGGPCDENELVTCIVCGGGGCGWTVLPDLERAIELAHTRATRRGEAQGAVGGGQIVRLVGLQAAPELNGEVGVALRFEPSNGRWLVRLRSGDGKKLKPANLEGLEGATGRVLCFWGDARWTRTQLLGEIAKRDWGLCHANVSDLTCGPAERWGNLDGRLAVAPEGEMTESYAREMEVARTTMQMHSAEVEEDDEVDI